MSLAVFVVLALSILQSNVPCRRVHVIDLNTKDMILFCVYTTKEGGEMPRGGKRSTSFKPTWNAGKTRLVRLPEVWVDDYIADAQVRDEGRDPEKEKMLFMIDKFIKYRCSEYGTNNAQKGEFSTDGSRWYYLNEFRKWINGNLS